MSEDTATTAKELLSKTTPWPWETKQGDRCWHVGSLDGTFETGCIMFAGGKGTSEGNAKFIARAPELLSALINEVERLQGERDGLDAAVTVQAESIIEFQSQQQVMKEAIEAADALIVKLYNVGAIPYLMQYEVDGVRSKLHSAVHPKGSEQQ